MECAQVWGSEMVDRFEEPMMSLQQELEVHVGIWQERRLEHATGAEPLVESPAGPPAGPLPPEPWGVLRRPRQAAAWSGFCQVHPQRLGLGGGMGGVRLKARRTGRRLFSHEGTR